MNTAADHSLVIDIGKTAIKCHLLDAEGTSIASSSMPNAVVNAPPYPHFDTEHAWQWLLAAIDGLGNPQLIGAINVTTHGACAVLLDHEGQLALPVLDYEYSGPQDSGKEYDSLRPDFAATLSPALPAGLNLGRQFYWQQRQFPQQFARVHRILLYPQYWVWRLSGAAVTEVTSLGCHTDLWLPREGRLSGLARTLGIEHAFPPLVPASQAVGCISPEVARETGLSSDCQVYAGVHDSNSSVARYLYTASEDEFTVISTGTWIVTLCVNGPIAELQEGRDMLANVDVQGAPLPSARFMGGREFDRICQLAGAGATDTVTPQDIERLLQSGIFALPSFTDTGGPFNHHAGRIIGQPHSGKGLATLYLALMIDYELDLLGARGDVIFGSFSNRNPLLCQLLAQLRPKQPILLSGDETSTIKGAWCLTRWARPPPPRFSDFERAIPTRFGAVDSYRREWRRLCAG